MLKFPDHLVKIRLAMVATTRIVADKVGDHELVPLDDMVTRADFSDEAARPLKLHGGEGRRDRRHSQRSSAERLVGDLQHE